MQEPLAESSKTNWGSVWGSRLFYLLLVMWFLSAYLAQQDEFPTLQEFALHVWQLITTVLALWALALFVRGFLQGVRSGFHNGPWRPAESELLDNQLKTLLDKTESDESVASKIQDLLSATPPFSELRPRRQGSKNLVVAEARRRNCRALLPFLETYAWPSKYRGELQRLLVATTNFIQRLPEEEVLEQLLRYAGIISDATAATILERFPAISNKDFHNHIRMAWGGNGYPRLLEVAIAFDNKALIDYLGGEFLQYEYWNAEAIDHTGEPLANYYEGLGTASPEFATRSSGLLLEIPKGKIRDIDLWKSKNPLAALFLVQATNYLAHPELVTRLLGAKCSTVQEMMVRRLASGTELANSRARENLGFLESCLSRPIEAQLRSLAIDALEQAVANEDDVRRIAKTMTRVLERPDNHYPREKVRGVLNKWKLKWPEAVNC
ncbi:MAG: hypothetical protein ACFCD0_04730 [Gemmataceae bacterium]